MQTSYSCLGTGSYPGNFLRGSKSVLVVRQPRFSSIIHNSSLWMCFIGESGQSLNREKLLWVQSCPEIIFFICYSRRNEMYMCICFVFADTLQIVSLATGTKSIPTVDACRLGMTAIWWIVKKKNPKGLSYVQAVLLVLGGSWRYQ